MYTSDHVRQKPHNPSDLRETNARCKLGCGVFKPRGERERETETEIDTETETETATETATERQRDRETERQRGVRVSG